jgi:hypothetical protein
MRKRNRAKFPRILSLFLISTTIQIIQPSASYAVSADCTVSAGQYCKATFSYSGAREDWVVPSGITSVAIDAAGAAGGDGTSASGKGARTQETITVTPGETLSVYVGQQGLQGGNSLSTGYVSPATKLGGGGGGGTFLFRSLTTPLVASGGGGGGQGPCCYSGLAAYAAWPGLDASITTTGTSGATNSGAYGAGGSSGNGGSTTASNGAGGGGGIISDGGYGSSTGQQGRGLPNGLTGGTASTTCNTAWGTGGNGGFGGGGGACGGAGGGGGGYSGGGGGGGYSHWGAGGGGGSYYLPAAASFSQTSGFQSGNGYLTITYLNAPTPTTFSTNAPSPSSPSATITYSIVFSEVVTGFVSSDISFASSSTCSTSLSGSGTTYSLVLTSCSLGTLTPAINALSVLGATTGQNGPASTFSGGSITIFSGATSVSVSLAGNANSTTKNRYVVVSASTSVAGVVTFYSNGRPITRCQNIATSGNAATCNWRPLTSGNNYLSALFVPTNNSYDNSSTAKYVTITKR